MDGPPCLPMDGHPCLPNTCSGPMDGHPYLPKTCGGLPYYILYKIISGKNEGGGLGQKIYSRTAPVLVCLMHLILIVLACFDIL